MSLPPPSRSTAAATQVLVSGELFRAICAFLPGRATWLVEIERNDVTVVETLKLTVELKRGTATPGLLPCLAIQRRDMKALQHLWLVHKQPQFHKDRTLWFSSAMHDAAVAGNLDALEWLYNETGKLCDRSAVSLAASGGFADVVRWLLKHFDDYSMDSARLAMAKAAIGGRLEVIKAFYEWRADACTPEMMDFAAEHGHFDIVTFLHEQADQGYSDQGCTTEAIDKAAENGHIEIVEWLLVNRNEGFTDAAMRGAVKNGHIPVVRYFWEEHRRPDTIAKLTQGMRAGVPHAIRRKHIEMLRYLHEHVGRDAFPRFALAIAADRTPDLPVVEFMLSTHRPEDDVAEALYRAVYNPDTMQCLLKHERFSMSDLTRALGYVKIQDADIAEPNALALEVAIALTKDADVATKSNYFAPTTASLCTRNRPRARHHVHRRPPVQQFLISSSV